MSKANSKIEEAFEKLSRYNDTLDELYLRKRQLKNELEVEHANADFLKEFQASQLNEVKKVNSSIQNLTKSLKTKKEALKKVGTTNTEENAKILKSIDAITDSLYTFESKKLSIEVDLNSIKAKLDDVYRKISELNEEKYACNAKICSLKDKKEKLKRRINALRNNRW